MLGDGSGRLLALLRGDPEVALVLAGPAFALRREAWDEVRFAGAPGSFAERLREAGWATLDASGLRPERLIFSSPGMPHVGPAALTGLARALRLGARATEILRDGGPRGVIGKLREREAPARNWWDEVPWSLYAEPRARPMPPRPSALHGPLTINWVVPAFFAGSGGHMTIFRLVEELERLGHHCRLLFTHTDGLLPREGVRIRQLVHEHFRPVRARCLPWRGQPLPDADVHVATHWDTAYVVDRRRRAGAGAYLVQDWEPSFYPAGTRAHAALETYGLGLLHATAGPWLAGLLRARGAEAMPFDLAVDHAEYFPEEKVQPEPRGRVAVYLRPLTERRGFELVCLALRELLQRRPSLEVAAYGTAANELALPFAARKMGVLGGAELRRLYCSSTVGLSCSLTNHGLVPQEMWACGLPVVEVDAESTRAVYRHGEEAVLAPLEPRLLAAAILTLIDDAPLRQRLREAGLRRALALSWEKSALQLQAALRRAVERELVRADPGSPSPPPRE